MNMTTTKAGQIRAVKYGRAVRDDAGISTNTLIERIRKLVIDDLRNRLALLDNEKREIRFQLRAALDAQRKGRGA